MTRRVSNDLPWVAMTKAGPRLGHQAAEEAGPAMDDDPHGSFDDGTQPAVLCATAIEYGLIAAL